MSDPLQSIHIGAHSHWAGLKCKLAASPGRFSVSIFKDLQEYLNPLKNTVYVGICKYSDFFPWSLVINPNGLFDKNQENAAALLQIKPLTGILLLWRGGTSTLYFWC